MANPTLIGQVTPFTGFTLATFVERLLATRGLTESEATGRTIATAADSSEARERARRAVVQLHLEFPTYFSDRTYSVTWTVGDHSILMPSDFSKARYVLFGGVPLSRLDTEERLRDLKSVANGQTAADQLNSVSGTKFYEVVGVSEVNATTDPARPVMRLYEQPTEASTLEVRYESKPPAMTTDAQVLPYDPIMQEWLLNKARALWASDASDPATARRASEDLDKLTLQVDDHQHGTREGLPSLRWKYPNQMAQYPR